MQRIFNNTDCYKSKLFSRKIQDACKLFLIELEKHLRMTYWSELYDSDTKLTSLEVFKDYYENLRPSIDLNKIFVIEEDIWTSYLNAIILGTDYSNFSPAGNPFTLNNKFDVDMRWGLKRCPIKQVLNSSYESASLSPIHSHNIKEKQHAKFEVFKQLNLPKKAVPKFKEHIIKFTKKENIDKKLLRKFRKYLKDLLKKNSLPLVSEFWKSFIVENLLPPISYKFPGTGENVKFKSFNTKYLLWLFSHEGGVELYNQFVVNKSKEIYQLFEDIVAGNQQDEIDLRSYINSLANLYSNSDSPKENSQINNSQGNSLKEPVSSSKEQEVKSDVEKENVSVSSKT
jgi:hypothetical protein